MTGRSTGDRPVNKTVNKTILSGAIWWWNKVKWLQAHHEPTATPRIFINDTFYFIEKAINPNMLMIILSHIRTGLHHSHSSSWKGESKVDRFFPQPNEDQSWQISGFGSGRENVWIKPVFKTRVLEIKRGYSETIGLLGGIRFSSHVWHSCSVMY